MKKLQILMAVLLSILVDSSINADSADDFLKRSRDLSDNEKSTLGLPVVGGGYSKSCTRCSWRKDINEQIAFVCQRCKNKNGFWVSMYTLDPNVATVDLRNDNSYLKVTSKTLKS